MDYKKLFLRKLNEEMGTDPNQGTPPPQAPSDGDVWRDNNPGIAGNEQMSSQFEVEGMPVDVAENYIQKIEEWRSEFDQVTDKLAEVYKFAAGKADQPGSGEIFKSIGSLVEGLTTNLGTLNGQLRTLGDKIRVSMNRENKKRGGVN